MALLTLGFKACNREESLQKMIQVEKTIPDSGYARAREIEQNEGYENVLLDLKGIFKM